MNFLSRKNNFPFSSYFDFCVFGESTNFRFVPLDVSNEIWSDISPTYKKHFQIIFVFIVKTGN